MAINTKAYIQQYLKIKDKNGDIVPFIINEPQLKCYNAIKEQAKDNKPIRLIILKARQMGFSTLTEAIMFKITATEHNVNSCVVAHQDQATTNLYNMFKRYNDNLDADLKPEQQARNGKELVFNNSHHTGLDSGIKCYTAGGSGIGRSDTIRNLHISELAFWPLSQQKETLLGILQAVPSTPESMIIIESTANGEELFKNMWDDAVAGKNDYCPVFCAWWELAEYQKDFDVSVPLTAEEKDIKCRYNLTDNQIEWRRWCIKNNCFGDERKFKQEYPACPEEAFQQAQGKYFKEFNEKVHVIEPFEPSTELKRYIACDYGMDMLACYEIAVDTQGKAFVIKEIFESGLIVSQAGTKIKEMVGTDKIYDWLAPPDLAAKHSDTGKSTMEIWQSMGLPFHKTDNNRISGWLNMHEWLQIVDDEQGKPTANLLICSNCVNLIRSIPALRVDTKNASDCDTEPHEFTHAPDAIRYFLAGRPSPTKIKKPEKSDWEKQKEKQFRRMKRRY